MAMISAQIPDWMKKAVEQIAKAKGNIPMSYIIRLALHEYLDKNGYRRPKV